jgi:hypothetical protein
MYQKVRVCLVGYFPWTFISEPISFISPFIILLCQLSLAWNLSKPSACFLGLPLIILSCPHQGVYTIDLKSGWVHLMNIVLWGEFYTYVWHCVIQNESVWCSHRNNGLSIVWHSDYKLCRTALKNGIKCLLFIIDLNNRSSELWKHSADLNIGLVHYSDPFCVSCLRFASPFLLLSLRCSLDSLYHFNFIYFKIQFHFYCSKWLTNLYVSENS